MGYSGLKGLLGVLLFTASMAAEADSVFCGEGQHYSARYDDNSGYRPRELGWSEQSSSDTAYLKRQDNKDDELYRPRSDSGNSQFRPEQECIDPQSRALPPYMRQDDQGYRPKTGGYSSGDTRSLNTAAPPVEQGVPSSQYPNRKPWYSGAPVPEYLPGSSYSDYPAQDSTVPMVPGYGVMPYSFGDRSGMTW